MLVLLVPCAATFGLGSWQLVRREKKVSFEISFTGLSIYASSWLFLSTLTIRFTRFYVVVAALVGLLLSSVSMI